jgi:hypothetical protein
MLRFVMCLVAALGVLAERTHACDVAFAAAPTVFVTSDLVATSAVQVAPLAVHVDAFAVQQAPVQVRVLAAPVVVRSCLAPRVRTLQRPARSRVTLRVR